MNLLIEISEVFLFPGALLYAVPLIEEIEESLSEKALARADLAGMASRNGGKGLVRYLLDIRLILFGKIRKQDQKVAFSFARKVHRLFNSSQLEAHLKKIAVQRSSLALVRSSPSSYLKAIRRAKKSYTYVEVFNFWTKGTLPERKYPVVYLKAALTLLQQAVAGTRLVKSTSELGALVRLAGSKIPNIIHPDCRRKLRQKNKSEIRFWLSALSFYRVFPLKGKASLATVEHGSGLASSFDYEEAVFEIGHFFASSPVKFPLARFGKDAFEEFGLPKPFIMEKSGPALSSSINTGVEPLLLALKAWTGSSGSPRVLSNRVITLFGKLLKLSHLLISVSLETLFTISAYHGVKLPPLKSRIATVWDPVPEFPHRLPLLTQWYDLFKPKGGDSFEDKVLDPGDPRLWHFPSAVGFSPEIEKFKSAIPNFLGFEGENFSIPPTPMDLSHFWKEIPKGLGKLALLPEAAGKVRVIAMVDAWTQWALAPLHDVIFKKLKKIDQDGTFDQTRALHQLRTWMKREKVKYLASYDLSAATDCLPVDFQVAILEMWLGPIPANLWRDLLVGRGYFLSKFMAGGYGLESKFYKYGVGQPMGALSSWAMLALTHHVIVQMAARRCKVTAYGEWFCGYALLGDDIQIAHKLVGDEYLRCMNSLGVKVGLHKSLISTSGFGEFAKKFSSRDRGIYTMVSIKELIVSKMDGSVLVSLAKKFNLSHNVILALRGKRHIARGSRSANYRTVSRWIRGLQLATTRPHRWTFDTLEKWLVKESLSKVSRFSDLPYFREEVIKLIILWHNSLGKMRAKTDEIPMDLIGDKDREDPSAVESFAQIVRAGGFVVPCGKAPLKFPAGDPRNPPLGGLYDFTPHRWVNNPSVERIYRVLFSPVLNKRALVLDNAQSIARSILEAISRRPNASYRQLVKYLWTYLVAAIAVHETRAQAVWQIRRSIVMSNEDFLSAHKLYNKTTGARSVCTHRFNRTLLDPVILPACLELKYPLGRVSSSVNPAQGLVGPWLEPLDIHYSKDELVRKDIASDIFSPDPEEGLLSSDPTEGIPEVIFTPDTATVPSGENLSADQLMAILLRQMAGGKKL